MSKRVKVTKELVSNLKTALGDPEADANLYAFFEARSLTTEPLKKGGFYQKARVSASTLREMETFLNGDGSAIPLHIMHNDRVLPVGKVIRAKLFDMPNGEVELRAQFVIPLSETDILNKVETSVVDEVSVGLLTKHAFCSECGFDYFGEDAGIENFFGLTCNEGHQIGVDGTHLRLVGLDDWVELSLVGQGAARNAKILPRAKQSMSKEAVERLAASGDRAELRFLSTSYKLESSVDQKTRGDKTMELEKLLAELKANATDMAQKSVEIEALKAANADLSARIETLTASVDEKTKMIAELEASKGEGVSELEAKLSTAQTELNSATEKLTVHAKAALVASGVADAEIPTGLVEMLELVEDKGLKLHQIILAGATSDGTKSDDKPKSVDYRKEAFKLSK